MVPTKFEILSFRTFRFFFTNFTISTNQHLNLNVVKIPKCKLYKYEIATFYIPVIRTKSRRTYLNRVSLKNPESTYCTIEFNSNRDLSSHIHTEANIKVT